MSQNLCKCRERSTTPLEYASEVEPASGPEEGRLVPIVEEVGVGTVAESADSMDTREVSSTREVASPVRGLQRAIRGRSKRPNQIPARQYPFHYSEDNPPFPKRLRLTQSQPSEFSEFHEDGVQRVANFDIAYFTRDTGSAPSAPSSDEDASRPSWRLAACSGACSPDCSGERGPGWPSSCCGGASQRAVGYFAT